MRMSKLFAPTLRENPTEAEVVSHQLLVRAGYIRQLARGIYSYLPLMWRVIKKIENIVREEMDRTGAQELLMPIMQPADIWLESGRWHVYGKELIRLKDRHERDMVLGPTHEEVITTLSKELQSYRHLPVNLYQIQNKYRDEIRPRFGLLRGREFIMKDAYSFHNTDEDLDREYDAMAEAYSRIFTRCGLETRMVRSDSGAIGGSVSHEFMVLTKTHSGEDDVYFCTQCNYAANSNRAESILPESKTDGASTFSKEEIVETPNCTSIDSLSDCLNIPPSLICKALLYMKNEEHPFLVLIRGDLEAEEIKVYNQVDALGIRLANDEEVKKFMGCSKGYVGVGNWSVHSINNPNFPGMTLGFAPGDAMQALPTILDTSAKELKNFVIGCNEFEKHKVGFNWPQGEPFAQTLEANVRDVKLARVGDICPDCKTGTLDMTRGTEVGNIFKLGTKYSKMMNATYSAEDGSEQFFIMGCYGLGVSRTAAAAIERFHDDNGMLWPIPIAPYEVVIVPVNSDDDVQKPMAEDLYRELTEAGIETVLDDRADRAGVKFKDADLIGFPIRVTVGKRAVEGFVELKLRDEDERRDVPRNELLSTVQDIIAKAKAIQSPSELAKV